jgi:subtilisin family serine protease
MRVLIQMRPQPDVVAGVVDPTVRMRASDVVDGLPGVALDSDYEPVAVPRPVPIARDGDPLSLNQPLDYSFAPDDASVLVRGEIPDDEVVTRGSMLTTVRGDVMAIYADAVIETTLTCGGDAPVGDWHDVESKVHAGDLKSEGLDGTGAVLAIVDTGINVAHLSSQLGRQISVDAARSWNPTGVTTPPGQFPVHHGTMCAFDALVAAPEAVLLDYPVLRSQRQGGSALDGLLSDAVAAFARLRQVLDAMPADRRSLVVSNSWGSFSPEWDFPPGHPGNYSDNPAHPFNLIVASLEQAGADILFAAGNCGRDCPDGRCRYPDRPIGGANSHGRVLSIGGVDVGDLRVGYSSQGPGRLTARKPDLCAYTHFAGSEAFGAGSPDSGTSAACPVAAGVVTAVRTGWWASMLTPAQVRMLLRRTADDHSDVGFDYDYGYGVIDTMGVINALRRRRKRMGG